MQSLQTIMTNTETWSAELTDTFGGEANYSWVNRAFFSVPRGASRRTIIRRGKAAIGLTGVRCQIDDNGTWITINPYGMCQIAFLTYECNHELQSNTQNTGET